MKHFILRSIDPDTIKIFLEELIRLRDQVNCELEKARFEERAVLRNDLSEINMEIRAFTLALKSKLGV